MSSVDGAAGLAGGLCQVLVGHPFDTIKVRLQTRQNPGGLISCIQTTVKNESVLGLYRGVSSPLLGIGICNLVLFTAYSRALSETDSLDSWRFVKAGAVAGIPMAMVTCPVELLKVKLQTQPHRNRLYRNIWDCGVKLVRSDGLFSLYRGFTITVLREIPSFAAYFGVYEYCKQHLQWGPIAAGGTAGIAAWIPCYPQDVIKSIIQSASGPKPSIHSAAQQIYRSDGLRGFFRGFTPTMIRAVPANAATFFAYELVRGLLAPVVVK